jgi:hypothetical protein
MACERTWDMFLVKAWGLAFGGEIWCFFLLMQFFFVCILFDFICCGYW